jgi:predicted molibdopterin-dependent oxidoreductase YjgC
VEISVKDAEKMELEDGTLVEVTSRRGSIRAHIKISTKAMPGTVFIPFHFSKAAANVLTNAALDPVCGIPEYKVCAVKLSKAA